MDIKDILSNLIPINKPEKIDALVQTMNEYGIQRTKANDLLIRLAIQRMSIQKYYIEKYGYKESSANGHQEKKKTQDKNSRQKTESKAKENCLSKNANHNQGEKKKKGTPKSLVVEKPQRKKRKIDSHSLSILRVFGAKSRKSKKKSKVKKNQELAKPQMRMGPISTTKSVWAIFVPFGGMNKRY